MHHTFQQHGGCTTRKSAEKPCYCCSVTDHQTSSCQFRDVVGNRIIAAVYRLYTLSESPQSIQTVKLPLMKVVRKALCPIVVLLGERTNFTHVSEH